jgi:hypothetical protein
MISEQLLQDLLAQKAESRDLDYKRTMNWSTASNEAKCELVKDILSMMNIRDGGRIIFGVDDDTCEPLGMELSDFTSFDTTKVNDFVHKYTDPSASCEVQKLTIDSKNFVVIDVPEFLEVPIICKADASSSNRTILKRGGLYLRTDRATSELISSPEHMRDLVNRSMMKRGDHLLRTIQGLLNGYSTIGSQETTDLYSSEIDDAAGFIEETLPSEEMAKGFYEVCAMPTVYDPARMPTASEVARNLENSRVSIRGWDFPHIDRDGAANFVSGRQSFTIWNSSVHRHIEAFRAYTSGLFYWRGTYVEDAPAYSEGEKKLSWVKLIFDITEFFLFLSRYYTLIVEEGSISVSLKLTTTRWRHLYSFSGDDYLERTFTCHVPVIKSEKSYTVSHLRAAYEEEARILITRIFETFNWEASPSLSSLIQSRQRQLIERRF